MTIKILPLSEIQAEDSVLVSKIFLQGKKIRVKQQSKCCCHTAPKTLPKDPGQRLFLFLKVLLIFRKSTPMKRKPSIFPFFIPPCQHAHFRATSDTHVKGSLTFRSTGFSH